LPFPYEKKKKGMQLLLACPAEAAGMSRVSSAVIFRGKIWRPKVVKNFWHRAAV